MNKVFLIGRLTHDPEIRYSQGATPIAVAKYSLAVLRRFKKDNEPDCDFINCIAFGKNGEFAEKFLKKGMRIAIAGSIRTGSYKNKDGQTVYTTDVVVDEHEFVENKASQQAQATPQSQPQQQNIPETGWVEAGDIDDDDIPF